MISLKFVVLVIPGSEELTTLRHHLVDAQSHLNKAGWEKNRELGTSRKDFGISRKNWHLAEGLGVLA